MVGIGSPFRGPCNGPWPAEIVGHIGSRDQHCNSAEDGIPVWRNTTELVDPANPTGPGIAPTAGSTQSCPPTSDPAPSTNAFTFSCSGPVGVRFFGDNCYQPDPSGAVVNLSRCRKRGFKNLVAIKGWLGRNPFTEAGADGCTDPITHLGFIAASPNGVRYLTKTVTATKVDDGIHGPGTVVTYSSSRTYTVSRFSGQITGSGSFVNPNDPANDDPAMDELMTWDYSCGIWVGTDTSGNNILDTLNGGPQGTGFDENTITSMSTSPNDVTFELVNHQTGGVTHTYSLHIHLSGEYYASGALPSVDDDLNTLLSKWDLSNDTIYPWRTDGNCHLAPILSYDEAGSATPDVFDADPNHIFPTAGTGFVIGLPVPAGYEPYWDVAHKNYQLCPGPPAIWTVHSIGAHAPSWCPNATRWMDDNQGQWGASGAWAAYNFAPGTLGSPFSSGLAKCVWAETIMFTVPSHDYARPCGPGDAAAIDQNTATCTEPGDGTGTLSGTLRFPSVRNPCPVAPAAGYQWNDNGAKGDFIWKEWGYNLRDIAIDPTLRPISTLLASFTATQDSICHTPCCPNVALISPIDYPFNNYRRYGMPVITCDQQLGSYWQAIPEQWMVDPLWQVPFQCPAVDGDGHLLPWAQDDGTGTVGQYFPPYEEARIAPPAGAPGYPPGLGINYGGVIATLNAGGTVPEEVKAPRIGQCYSATNPGRWVTQGNQEDNCYQIDEDECNNFDP